ncbi:hypothetical protein [Paraburkholderia sp. BCC1885]|uniref:hypothetical protein n=1 Tax=Paraburkholderia sp. BCC1885 TaxID=2562669 RepID=UPI001182542D|nr:hypothetical protein [Paraburkholderia sp. BCC1885]
MPNSAMLARRAVMLLAVNGASAVVVAMHRFSEAKGWSRERYQQHTRQNDLPVHIFLQQREGGGAAWLVVIVVMPLVVALVVIAATAVVIVPAWEKASAQTARKRQRNQNPDQCSLRHDYSFVFVSIRPM